MGKRLTDVAKWKNPWFRKLPSKLKLLFLYMLDECDNVGVLHLDFELIGFVMNEAFTREEFDAAFAGKVVWLADDKIIVRKFVMYQQNENSPFMKKNLERLLERHGIGARYRAGEFL